MTEEAPSRLSSALLLILFAASFLLLLLFGLFAVYAFILMRFSLLVPEIVQAAGLAWAFHFRKSGQPFRAWLALFFAPLIGMGSMIALQEAFRS